MLRGREVVLKDLRGALRLCQLALQLLGEDLQGLRLLPTALLRSPQHLRRA